MQVNSDSKRYAIVNNFSYWDTYREPDRLAVTSGAMHFLVADSSKDGIIVIFFWRLRLCADAFFVRF